MVCTSIGMQRISSNGRRSDDDDESHSSNLLVANMFDEFISNASLQQKEVVCMRFGASCDAVVVVIQSSLRIPTKVNLAVERQLT